MNLRTCSFEKEITQALKSGHWPEGCAPELRAHVDACAQCRDLVLVTQAFQQARSESAKEAPLGAPGLIWWKAQLRRRREATARVSRPVTVAETFALVLTLAVAAVFVASQYNHGLQWSTWWAEITSSRSLHVLAGSAKPDWSLFLLLPVAGVLVLLSGLIVYLASEKS
jgi:hypothetical protein